MMSWSRDYVPAAIENIFEQRRSVAYLDGLRVKVETQKELDALMPRFLAKAFAGKL